MNIVIVYLFRTLANVWRCRGSGRWPLADATVTADPERFTRFGGSVVEIAYSYRVQGELYTGLHEEPVIAASKIEYIKRFPKGRHIVVRVKPDNPEVSVVREGDQGALSQHQQLTP